MQISLRWKDSFYWFNKLLGMSKWNETYNQQEELSIETIKKIVKLKKYLPKCVIKVSFDETL